MVFSPKRSTSRPPGSFRDGAKTEQEKTEDINALKTKTLWIKLWATSLYYKNKLRLEYYISGQD